MSEPSTAPPQGRALPLHPGLHPLALGALAVGLAALAALAVADRAEAQAMINNGVIELGVDATGQLNICCGAPSSGTGTTNVGLRYLPTGAEATAPGCLCEGWGVSYDGAVSGYANNAIGSAGLVLNSFVGVNGGSTAFVDVSAGDLHVVHDYHPSATPDLYEATVTITNRGPVAHNNVEYRRVMDWDVEPTAFSEFVTIDDFGNTPAPLRFSSNDGFASADPLVAWTNLGFIGPGTGGGPFFDAGPADHGALFEFDFGTLAPGASVTFNIYYGAAPDEPTAYADLAAVGATLYSLGQPDTAPASGKPNTFMFAFGGGALAVHATSSCEAHAVLVRETDLSGTLGDAEVPLVSSAATAVAAPGLYSFSPFGAIPSPDAHADAEEAEANYSNLALGVAASARAVGSWCDALAVDDPAGAFTEAFGQVELADLALSAPGISLAAQAGVFETKAWGFPGGTGAAWRCDVTAGSASPPNVAWSGPCPGPLFLNPAPGVTLWINEQFGPVVTGGEERYGGALAHLQIVVPGVTQLDVYLGYVEVGVTPS